MSGPANQKFLFAFLFLFLSGCSASHDLRSLSQVSERDCSVVRGAISGRANSNASRLEEIALRQNSQVVLRKAKIAKYQDPLRLADHIGIGYHPITEAVPFSINGIVKAIVEGFRSQNPESDPQLQELLLELSKAEAEVRKSLHEHLEELKASQKKLEILLGERRKAYAEMVAANSVAKSVPILAAQKIADKAQRDHAKAEDSVRAKELKLEKLRAEILHLTGCLRTQETASRK